jgi:glycosyltransferase involved in cell wall biosynthesis
MSSSPKPWVLVVGSKGLFAPPEGFQLRELGYVTAEQMMTCYSAADVFVLPTLADNLPVSLLEAHACGTPAVAFDVGGVPDIVQHMTTGYLARHKDAEDLARGLDGVLQHSELRGEFRARARQRIEKEFNAELQVERYADLYRAVRERRAGHTTRVW